MNYDRKKYYIQFENLDNGNDVLHLYTKKPFDFNENKVIKNDINSQYSEIEKIINYSCKKIIKAVQTHSDVVKKVDNNNLYDKFENVDGLITDLKGIALVTYLADCQGVLLYDKNKKVIGNIHSGWRGTLTRIIFNAINIMVKDYGCDVKDIEVYFCPSILKCCFEVDEEVKDMFLNEFTDINIDDFIFKGQLKEGKKNII